MGSPKSKEQSKSLNRLPAGRKVLVYRTVHKGWEGPFLFVSIYGETAVIQKTAGRRLFRSTFVITYRDPVFTLAATSDERQNVPTSMELSSKLQIGKDKLPERMRQKIHQGKMAE